MRTGKFEKGGPSPLNCYWWIDPHGAKRGPVSLLNNDEDYVKWWCGYIPLIDVLRLLERFGKPPLNGRAETVVLADPEGKGKRHRQWLYSYVMEWRKDKLIQAVANRLGVTD